MTSDNVKLAKRQIEICEGRVQPWEIAERHSGGTIIMAE